MMVRLRHYGDWRFSGNDLKSTFPSEKVEFKNNHLIKEINAEKRKTKTRVKRSIVKALKDREREFGPPGKLDHEPDIEEVHYLFG